MRVALLIGSAVICHAMQAAATHSERPVTEIAASSCFALGGVGIGGAMSEGERQLRAVLKQGDASQQLQAALPHATLEGQLYILVGLRRCDFPAYRQIFHTLRRPNAEVEVMHGCIRLHESFREVLSRINGGSFDGILERPASSYGHAIQHDAK